ncbi:enoyl-CoA hydratase/isomerase family protein [Georgenia subflava]|uniref:Enoyl-CoA hydratase/isomerase family protein n=1 Tax=Georgenia subflava TaxID=1622177 RepID=A0A6N7EKN5_9MICO|nr:enoyl-CoA hydratase/isomerase family protein [Georgenia subflava]MPV37105.1 enoyl-CoA hydratase/isomerase family protein [Georgenia subflava]
MATVNTWRTGGTARIELNRPRALNALDLEMIRDMRATLEAWRDDEQVTEVLVTSASDRAFCAGGDVRAVREEILAGRGGAAGEFFAEEYALNRAIAEYPKPYVAVIDGAAMGGGLGISVHARQRVVTERVVMAMPETAIGFAPDVGASHFLTRLSGDPTGALGTYLALTGTRVGPADALATGLATHLVPSAAVADLVAQAEHEGVAAALAHHVTDVREAGAPVLAAHTEIDRHFAPTTVPEILERLTAADDEWAAQARTTLEQMSPTSLVATLELLRAGTGATLAACLGNELRLATWLTGRPDFVEGVRAVLVDKDRRPRWDPSAPGAVDVGEIRAVLGG